MFVGHMKSPGEARMINKIYETRRGSGRKKGRPEKMLTEKASVII